MESGLECIGQSPVSLGIVFTTLSYHHKQLVTLSGIRRFNCLKTVNVSHNYLTEIQELENLPWLLELNVSHNNLTECLDFSVFDASKWQECEEVASSLQKQCRCLHCGSLLQRADFSHNSIGLLSNYSRFEFLEEINLSYNQLDSVESIGSLPNIRHLNVANNRLVSLVGLQKTQLVTLNASSNRILSLSHLSTVTTLISVSLSRNDIRSLASINCLPCMKDLDISFNCIAEFEQISSLSGAVRLGSLIVLPNPCYTDDCEKLRTSAIAHLPSLLLLDGKPVKVQEKVKSCNRFNVSGLSDWPQRIQVYSSLFSQNSEPIIEELNELRGSSNVSKYEVDDDNRLMWFYQHEDDARTRAELKGIFHKSPIISTRSSTVESRFYLSELYSRSTYLATDGRWIHNPPISAIAKDCGQIICSYLSSLYARHTH